MTLATQYFAVFTAVSSYWICSISLVFLNKYLLSSPNLQLDAPLFITWFQCLISVILCILCSYVSAIFPHSMTFPNMSLNLELLKKVLPLSIVFVAMITFNNLCLMHVSVSFYYVGRSLTTIFNVICSYFILGQSTSRKAVICCGIIILGFFIGVDQEDAIGSLSMSGVFYGVLASLCVALNAIYTKKTLPLIDKSVWRLTFYNNVNACFLFLPLMVISREFTTLFYFPQIFLLRFWIIMTLSGFFGFIMGYVTGWQIQVTSALTHNISGTAKAAFQTLMAVLIWSEVKTLLWWLSNIVVLFGSGAYTYFQKLEMDKHFLNTPSVNKN